MGWTQFSVIMECLRRTSNYYLKSIVKLAIAIVLGIGLIICLEECYNFYCLSPTYTEINLVEQHEAEFPALTFCPYGEVIKEDVLKVCVTKRFIRLFHN